MEEWRDIEEFKGYQVSNEGNVRSFIYPSHYGRKERSDPYILKQSIDDRGRPCVYLYDDEKRYTKRVSRLMAEAFIPNPNNYRVVRHLDDNPRNNSIDNLAWGTHSDNTQDSIKNGTFYRSKLKKPVCATNVNNGEKMHFCSLKDASNYFGKAESTISASIQRRSTTSGYKFEFLTTINDEGD